MGLYENTLVWHFEDSSQLMLDASRPQLNNPTIYTVPEGVTLLDISWQFYGDHSSWYVIAMANNIIDPFESLLGKSLIIP